MQSVAGMPDLSNAIISIFFYLHCTFFFHGRCLAFNILPRLRFTFAYISEEMQTFLYLSVLTISLKRYGYFVCVTYLVLIAIIRWVSNTFTKEKWSMIPKLYFHSFECRFGRALAGVCGAMNNDWRWTPFYVWLSYEIQFGVDQAFKDVRAKIFYSIDFF